MPDRVGRHGLSLQVKQGSFHLAGSGSAPTVCSFLLAFPQDRAAVGASVHAYRARNEYRPARTIPLQQLATWTSALLWARWTRRRRQAQAKNPPTALLLLHDQLRAVWVGLPGSALPPRNSIAGRT